MKNTLFKYETITCSLCWTILPIALQLLPTQHTVAESWNGPTFREFSGVNKMHTDDPLFYNGVLGWYRSDFSFKFVQPARNVWSQAYMTKHQDEVLALQKAGAVVLPILGFMGWAGQNPTNTARSAPAVESDWTNYIDYVVTNLNKAPYNLKYFQIWNEAIPDPRGWGETFSDPVFYDGKFDDYMSKIHLPAAKVIHEAGCKVVYGGYPGCKWTSATKFVEMMNHYNAWGSIDVISIHYYHWRDLEVIHKAAVAAGYPNLGYWQTEWGYTTNAVAISSEYPFAIYWALTSGVWNGPNKFKYFYYSGNYTPDPGDEIPAHKKSLYDGGSLTTHGMILKNMAGLLGGGTLSALTGVSGTGLTAGQNSSIAAFKIGDSKAIIAVGLDSSDYAAHATTTLTIPIEKSQIIKAERVDLDGSHIVDITSALMPDGLNTTLKVSARDASGSNANSWNSGVRSDTDLAVFYVRLTVGSSTAKQASLDR